MSPTMATSRRWQRETIYALAVSVFFSTSPSTRLPGKASSTPANTHSTATTVQCTDGPASTVKLQIFVCPILREFGDISKLAKVTGHEYRNGNQLV